VPTEAQTAGFTLLETVAALAILSIALVSLFDAQSKGLRLVGATSAHAKARILANSILAETASQRGPGLRSSSGRYDSYAWYVDVAPAGSEWAQLRSDANWRMFHIRVTVAWARDRQVQLETLKLGRINE
jgi:prepilin-type N-terminal cleavage/methylation domain-containing protein